MFHVKCSCFAEALKHRYAGLALGVFLALVLVLPAGAAEERLAPEYTARRLGSSEAVSLAALCDQVVLLNTWATWCAPCRQEMPAFETLYREYRDRGLVVVGVNIDEGQADAAVERYVAGLKISFPIWRDPANRFAKRFRVLGVPESFLIDRASTIVRHWRGPFDPQAPEHMKTIQAALGPPATAISPPPPAAQLQRIHPALSAGGGSPSSAAV